MKTLIIFGCGDYGKRAFYALAHTYDIKFFCDNDQSKWGSIFCGKVIISPDDLRVNDFDDVVIAVASHIEDIEKQLRGIGIKRIKLFQLYYDASDMTIRSQLQDISRKDFLTGCRYYANRIKKVLMFAYYYPPTGGAGIQRTLKFAKYLPDFGYEVTIITRGFADYNYPHDESMINQAPHASVIRIQDNPRCWQDLTDREQQELYDMFLSVTCSTEWMDEYISTVRNSDRKLIPEDAVIWANECVQRICDKVDVSEYDVVYTTSSPYSAHLIGYCLKKRFGIKWVADYRDPWCENDDFNQRFNFSRINTINLERKLEECVNRACDRVIAACDITNEPSDVVTIITNGYDEEDFIDLRRHQYEKFTICYNGMMYKQDEDNAICLLNVINRLLEEKKIEKGGIQWIINGICNEKRIASYDKYGIVITSGALPHKQSLEIAVSSDVLILFGAYDRGSRYVWRGKTFEYFRSMRPILSFSAPYGVQHDAIKELNQGITVYPNETDRIEAFLLGIYEEHCKGKKEWGNKSIVSKYERKQLTEKLAEVFDSVTR